MMVQSLAAPTESKEIVFTDRLHEYGAWLVALIPAAEPFARTCHALIKSSPKPVSPGMRGPHRTTQPGRKARTHADRTSEPGPAPVAGTYKFKGIVAEPYLSKNTTWRP